MLSLEQLTDRVLEFLRDETAEASDFEEWFALASWNAHKQGSPRLTELVFEIEGLLTLFHEAQFDLQGLKLEIGRALRPFVIPRAMIVAKHDIVVPSACSSAVQARAVRVLGSGQSLLPQLRGATTTHPRVLVLQPM